jgi:hypothetical protein
MMIPFDPNAQWQQPQRGGTTYIQPFPPPPRVEMGRTERFYEADIVALKRRVAELERKTALKIIPFPKNPERPEDV